MTAPVCPRWWGALAAAGALLAAACAGPSAEGAGAAPAPPAAAGAHVEAPGAAPAAVAPAAAPVPSPPAVPAAPSCALPADAPSSARLSPVPAGGETEAAPELRLPEDARPVHAALSLALDPSQPRFSGTVVIGLQLDRPRSVIWLHGRGLHVTEAWLDTTGARLLAAFAQVDDDGLAKVTLPCRVEGRAALHLSWDAPFDPQLNGIFLAQEAGESYAASFFEATGARRAIPCFDEPAFKHPWDVELQVRAGDVAVANGPQLSEGPADGGKRRVRFATTPPLPSYLLAFAAGPLEVVQAPPLPPDGARTWPLPLRGIAPKGRGGELGFALQATAELTLWEERWFGIPFPYAKLDQIAVPDFAPGAMENAGAIVSRESLLLWTPGKDTVQAQGWIAGTIAHEVAHQWFGDLVTPRWWTDIWLNESFASWIDAKAEDAWRPELRAGVAALLAAQRVMDQDALPSARAIRQPVHRTSEIDNQFDPLTYEKGQAVLAMFERWVGPERFREGVRAYLAAHAHGSGSSEDLFAALSQAAGRDVGGPFKSFLDQPGVPLVRARLSCSGKGPRLLLEQQRHRPLGAPAAEGPAQLWRIPVCARAGVGREVREACTLLEAPSGAIALPGTRCPDWVLPNAGADGYFRWTLDLPALRSLLAALPRLPLRERISLGGAIAAGWSGGQLPAAEALAAAAPLARDPDGAVAEQPMELLEDARAHALRPARRPALEAFARGLYQPALHKLGWRASAGEEPRVRQQRGQVIKFLLLTARDPAVRAEAARLGRAYANLAGGAFDLAAVEPELAGTALAAAIFEGDAPLFEALAARLETTADSTERGRMLAALREAREPKLVARALELSVDPRLRRTERTTLLYGLLLNEESREAAWGFVQQRWDALVPLIPEGYATGLASAAVASSCDAGRAQAAADWLRPRTAKLPGIERELTQALDEARTCAARAAAHRAGVEAFLAREVRLPKAR